MDDTPGGVGELFLMEEEVPPAALQAAIRRATLALTFMPVFMGSAYKNKVHPPSIVNPTSLRLPPQYLLVRLWQDSYKSGVKSMELKCSFIRN